IVQLKDAVTDSQLEPIRRGIRLNKEETCLPAEVSITGEKECHIILKEGKFHEIKRMFLAIGTEVVYLKRIRMKNLILDESLKPGEYRPLTDAELNGLKESAL
ncbi:MAG: 16S rRNA pseudouridine(516) synthase, partial [Solobacterium sp.]|nr:16S rRNA pseudouridine(516) synthase [Solobacterium sp.]